MKTIKDYFRTTYHDGIQLESDLKTHGLDSFDCIEIAMKLEDDLGYIIPAENLALFKKPKHYVNYIEQVESFKKQRQRNPEC